MEISDGAVVESEDAGYPFADLSKLRTEAGAFMHRVLDEQDDGMDDGMDDESQHVITPDSPWMSSADKPLPPQGESHRCPVPIQPLAVGIWNPSSKSE